MIRPILILICLLSLTACSPQRKSTSEILKEISYNETKVKWVREYNTDRTEFSDIVQISKGDNIETLCVAKNVADIDFYYFVNKDKPNIAIGFFGIPYNPIGKVDITNTIFDHTIFIDTNYIASPNFNLNREFYHGHGFDKEISVKWLDDVGVRFKAEETHILMAERILKENIDNLEKNQPEYTGPRIVNRLDQYFRQYIGFVNNEGEDVIWINFWIKEDVIFNPETLSKYIVTSDGGGSDHWSIYVNITTQELCGMRVNGPI